MGAVNALIGSVTGAIQQAMSSLTHLVNAAAMSVVCAAAKELNGFMDKIASPALKAALPAPI